MNTDRDEESEEFQSAEPLQFSLRTLMIVITAAAIFFSLIAWWGFYPFVLIFSSILSVALGTFLGLLLCSYIGLGFEFTNLHWDMAKCLIVGCSLIAFIYLQAILQIPFMSIFMAAYVLVSTLCYWFVMKLAWDDLGSLAIFISAIVSFFTWAFAMFFISLFIRFLIK